ncbi:hypothetical protein NLI96_g6009 [Meripilus lineatus]|uniref:DUF453-domain-containing protein n=1 Tax=Meripilus lineatus TaxID=2056292 RepID=A0AAD5YGD6_9APHY|nr:hypothetical protein NLI96_g6009 [Physisporinus lineatus]
MTSLRYKHTTANPLPATFYRGGTSKGIFINRADLPENISDWDPIFLGIMGSPDPEHGRQLNGMGGGVSSLSKICVVGEPSEARKAEGIDVDYTFVQVGIRDSAIDYSGNCGNLSSMIGVFALDEGLCKPRTVDSTRGVASVRSWNTNTNKVIDTTFPVADSDGVSTPSLNLPQAVVAGVPGKASQIVLDFVSPGGARTGKVLPTGLPTEIFEIPISIATSASKFRISLVDATNPTVFILAEDLRTALHIDPDSPIDFANPEVREVMETIRRRGAERMGLDPSAQAQPKIAALSPPSPKDSQQGVDIVIHAFSMGVLHKAVPMTVGLCLGVASGLERTIAWEIVTKNGQVKPSNLVRILHPGGLVEVGADIGEGMDVKSAKVVRTGRRLMKGVVWW